MRVFYVCCMLVCHHFWWATSGHDAIPAVLFVLSVVGGFVELSTGHETHLQRSFLVRVRMGVLTVLVFRIP